jgi:hypothetical protein
MSALHQYYGALSSGTLILRGFVVWYINITGLCRLVHQYYGALSSGTSILRGFVLWYINITGLCGLVSLFTGGAIYV